ncbi:MAG: nucleotide exchange factor GrpE [bacterium]|nr:nucleotide exchange factor GrpE [bacterium]
MSGMHRKKRDRDDVKSSIEIAMGKAEEAAGAPPPAPPAAAAISGEELAALREKAARADEYHDRFLRAAADLENYRKRVERERADLLKFGQEEFMAELILVLDNFERALAAAGSEADANAVLEGVRLINRQLSQVLARNGLQPVEALGRPFDPRLHEAVSQVETDDHPEGTVVAETLRGYLLNGRLLRPAAVTVAAPKRQPVGAPDGGGPGDTPEG